MSYEEEMIIFLICTTSIIRSAATNRFALLQGPNELCHPVPQAFLPAILHEMCLTVWPPSLRCRIQGVLRDKFGNLSPAEHL